MRRGEEKELADLLRPGHGGDGGSCHPTSERSSAIKRRGHKRLEGEKLALV